MLVFQTSFGRHLLFAIKKELVFNGINLLRNGILLFFFCIMLIVIVNIKGHSTFFWQHNILRQINVYANVEIKMFNSKQASLMATLKFTSFAYFLFLLSFLIPPIGSWCKCTMPIIKKSLHAVNFKSTYNIVVDVLL